MKKIFTIITLAMVMCMASFAFAASSIEDTIAKGVKAHQTTIDVSSCNATPQEVMATFTTMFNTNPAMSALLLLQLAMLILQQIWLMLIK